MKTNEFLWVSLAGIALIFSACDKDDPNPNGRPDTTTCLHSVMIDDQSYIDLFEDLNVEKTTTANALVHDKLGYIFTYKDYVFVLEETTDRLFKYKKNINRLEKSGNTVLLPAKSATNAMAFLNDHKGYITASGTGKVIVFNPSSMTILKEIDLSRYAIGEGDNNPEPIGIIIRDNLLYVTLWQAKSLSNPNPGGHIAIINTVTDEPVKMISDYRAGMIGSGGPAGDPFIDENGDIYFYCSGGFGYSSENDGLLRVKKGETEFDKSYYFPIKGQSIEGIAGNAADYMYPKVYAGSGKLYTYLNVSANASNPPDYVNDKSMQPFELDIYGKTFCKLDLPPTTGWSACVGIYDNYIVFGMAGEQGIGYYLYDYKTGKVIGKKVSTQGSPFYFAKF
ncbi:MAG TPA: hypothetical protein DEQ30_01785 [Porphyromonadaceae bacterium]|nr:hypothetical protein [Porphyromonadaceae bacterium]